MIAATPELAAVAHRIRGTGTSRVPCPECDRGDRDTALAVTVDDRGTVWHCFRCGWSGADNTVTRASSPSARPATSEASSSSPDAAIALYRASQPIERGTVAADYLLARGCVLPPRDGGLRWHPSVRHMSGHVGPALVALVTHAETGEPLSVHRTWIDPAKPGHKAAIEPPRTYWTRLPTKGGCVRLWPDEAVTMGLGIAEGIETALALAHGFAPVWSCLDAGHMASLPVLDGIESLMIAVDRDDAGIRATRACADRWSAAGVAVAIVAPRTAGHDIADEAAA